MTYLSEAHADWHSAYGYDAVCPLDCGIGEYEYDLHLSWLDDDLTNDEVAEQRGIIDPENPPVPVEHPDYMEDAPEWFRNAPFIES